MAKLTTEKTIELTVNQADENKQVLIIQARSGWEMINWQEVWHYREMLVFLVWRDWKTQYAQTVLGIGWAIIRPIFTIVVFTVLFGNLLKVDSEGVPYAVFSLAGLVPWWYFSNAVNAVSTSLGGGMSLISKIYFPHIILPMQAALRHLLDFIIALFLLSLLMVWFRIVPTGWIVLLPLLIFLMVLLAMGIGMFVTSLAVQYRDVGHIMGLATSMFMYVSPIIYPTSLIPEQYRLLYALNPMVGIIEGFRAALLATGSMPWDLLAMSTLITIILLFGGIFVFLRMERNMVDVA